MKEVREFSKSEKLLMGIVAILAVIGIVYFLIKPSVDDISISRDKIIQEQAKLDEFKNVETKNKEKQVTLGKLKKEYDEARREIPIDEKNPEIAKSVNDTAVANDVQLNSVNFGIPSIYQAKIDSKTAKNTKNTNTNKNKSVNAAKDALLSVPVSIEIKGDFTSVVKFINNIEKDKRVASVNNSMLSKNKKDKTSAGIIATINTSYYYVSTDDKLKGVEVGDTDVQYPFADGFSTGIEDPFKE